MTESTQVTAATFMKLVESLQHGLIVSCQAPTDSPLHEPTVIAAIAQVIQAAQTLGWHYQGLTWSPLQGPAGNIEYLLWLSMNSILPHRI